MATITHSSMRKQSSVQPQPQPQPQQLKEVFVVDDLSEFGEPQQPAPEPKRVEVTSDILEQPKKRIEDLIFLGRISKTITIAGHDFEITTLSHKEHNHMMRELKDLVETSGQVADVWKVRVYTLAYAVKSIDGTNPAEFDVDGEFKSDFDKKVAILDNMQLRVVEKLFEVYSGLLDESEKALEADLIKK